MARSVHLFVYDGFADWEAAFAVAGIQQPAFQRAPGRYTVCTVGLSQSPVRSMGGVAVLPDQLLDTLSPADSAMLILPGGLGWEEGQHMAAVEAARRFLAADVPVAAICGATAGLAPLEFAREIFRCLDLYDPPVLDAWYDLYRTGHSEHYARMQQAAEASADVAAERAG